MGMSDAVSLPFSDDQSSLGRRSRWRVILWLGGIFLLLLSIIPISWAVIRWRTNQAIAAELDRIRAAGEPASFDDVIDNIPPVAPEKDCTQLYDEVFAIITSQVWERRAGSLPYVGVGDGAADVSSIPPPGIPWRGLEAAAKFIDGENYNLMTLDKAAALGGECRFPLTVEELTSSNVLGNSIKSRSAARLLVLRSIVAAHRNDVNEAQRSLATLGILPNCLASEPKSISLQLRAHLHGVFFDQSVEVLDDVPFTDEQLATLQIIARNIDYSKQLYQAVLFDRLHGAQCFDGNYVRDHALADLMSKRAWWWYCVSHVDAAEYWQAMRRFCGASNSNDVEMALRNINQVNDNYQGKFARTRNLPERYHVTSNTVGGAWYLAHAAVRGTAASRVFDAFVACHRWKLKHGDFPNGLEELVPDYLTAVPQDPFANAPIRMTEINGDLVIYSAGPDGIDDGGDARSDDLRYRSNSWKRTYEESRAAVQGAATSVESIPTPAQQENTSP
jgi:hypothetical protein